MKKVDAKETGQRIHLFMINRGIGSDDMAARLNYSSRVTINRWIRGEAIPSYENLVNMSDVLNCRPEDLVVLRVED